MESWCYRWQPDPSLDTTKKREPSLALRWSSVESKEKIEDWGLSTTSESQTESIQCYDRMCIAALHNNIVIEIRKKQHSTLRWTTGKLRAFVAQDCAQTTKYWKNTVTIKTDMPVPAFIQRFVCQKRLDGHRWRNHLLARTQVRTRESPWRMQELCGRSLGDFPLDKMPNMTATY